MQRFLTRLFLTLIVVAVSMPLLSQEKIVRNPNQSQDTANVEDWATISYFKEISPTIQLFYSWSTPYMLDEKHKDYMQPFTEEFAPGNYGEIRLGTTKQSMLYPNEGIGEYDFSSVFFKYMGPSDLGNQGAESNNDYELKTIQFGFFNANGYGYQSKTNKFGIYFYTGSGIHWSDVSYTVDQGNSSSNAALNTYAGNLRFGQTWESGIRVPVLGPLSFIGAYETSIIYPRHLFWKWAISGIIEGIAIGGLGEFSKWIMEESPIAGPIVNWVLKTGAYYAIYELRKSNMNWPYETSPPLTINSWKAGISLEF